MRIVHATDFSEGARRADALAVRLAAALRAELVLVHVVQEAVLFGEGLMRIEAVREVFEGQQRWARERLAARAAEIAATGVPARGVVRLGAPAGEIVRLAEEERADLIVLGTHGRGPIGRFLVGSVADRVVRTAPCAVVTVRDSRSETAPAS